MCVDVDVLGFNLAGDVVDGIDGRGVVGDPVHEGALELETVALTEVEGFRRAVRFGAMGEDIAVGVPAGAEIVEGAGELDVGRSDVRMW